MSLTSFAFIGFLLVCGIVYYLVPKKAQWIVLLIASFVFYVLSSSVLVAFMLISTLLIYLGALKIQAYSDEFKAKKAELDKSERKLLKSKIKKNQKIVLTAIVLLNIAILAVLKYCNFFGGIVNSIGSLFGDGSIVPMFELILPLGISYYTLMSISYIVDVYRGTVKAEKNPFRLLLFVSYFPHIIEGPFDRYSNLDKQFREPHHFDYETIRSGAVLLLYGMFKKVVIADRAGLIASGIFDNAAGVAENSVMPSGTSIAFAVVMYTLQLYCDFSGCIEIVSGASELFGIKIAKNFNQPFFSRSINEFWRRWHITLGLWLKEYVFYPVSLSGSFKKVNGFVSKHIKSEHLVKMIPAAYALFFVWFCNGIWHGASGKYIFYGLYYYVLMMLGEFTKPFTDKLCAKLKINRDAKPYHLFQMVRTFIIINIGMLIFRSETIRESTDLFFSIFKSVNFVEIFKRDIMIYRISLRDFMLLALCIAVLFIIELLLEKGHDVRSELFSKPLILRWIIYIILIFSIFVFGIYGSEFGAGVMIYGQF